MWKKTALVITIVLVESFAAASAGSAQTPSVGRLHLLDGDSILGESDRETYFNVARCACDTRLTVEVSVSGASSADGRFEVLYGRSCVESDGELDDDCVTIYSEDIDSIPATIEESVRVSALAGGCDPKEEGRALYAVFDEGDDGDWTLLDTLDYRVDTEAPPAPTAIEVLAGEELAEVVFEEPDSTSDVSQYQVLCSSTSTAAAVPKEDVDFDTTSDLCSADDDPFAGRRACANSSARSDSVTVLGLDDGFAYVFEVVSIDEARNPSEPVEVGEVVPAPEEDFWERYKNSGGGADGEHCFVATAAYGDYEHPQVRVLRRFRDEVLRPTVAGRALVETYYLASPALADWIANNDLAQGTTQALLWPLVGLATVVLWLGPRVALALAVIVALGALRARRRHS